MKTPLQILFAILLLTLFVPHATRADPQGNQRFETWSSFGVGSNSTLETTIMRDQNRMLSTMKVELIEKANDHLVLLQTNTIINNGQTSSLPPMKVTLKPIAGDPTEGLIQTGTEDVTTAGKKISCKIFQNDPKAAATGTMKLWSSQDIPGGIVKMDLVFGADSNMQKISSCLKSFEIK